MIEDKKFAQILLDDGYSSCQVCFNVKLIRRGFLKWLEDKNILNPKTQGFALSIRGWEDIIILSSNEHGNQIIKIISTKINGLR